MTNKMKGFTLVELSVALLALSMVLLGATLFWQRSEGQRVGASQQDVQLQARQATVGFLHANHRLPCPALDANGEESCAAAGGTGLRQVGYLPWKTLNLPRPEAGRLRYGVYREPTTEAATDKDLAVSRDRMKPLRVATPNPKPQNGNAPNGNAPPPPVAIEAYLGPTQSGNDAAPLNSACNPSSNPPCSSGGVSAVNQVDACLALNTAAEVINSGTAQLGVMNASVRRPAAFVIVAPGLLDADGDGQFFDGANASATDAAPTFESVARANSSNYDDQVLAVSHAELFTELACGAGLSGALHAHFNAATASFLFERALYDYRDQLYVVVKLAEADVAAAAAGVLGATAGITDAAQAMASALADSFATFGARAFQVGLAAVGIAASVAGGATAALGVVDAAATLVDTKKIHDDFAARTTAATELSISINRNALTADAIGF